MILGIDGLVGDNSQALLRNSTACCPPDICSLDTCGLICNFIQGLPSGPLWDDAKKRSIGQALCDPEFGGLHYTCDDSVDSCTSMVNHAIYSAKRLEDLIYSALWPAIRESNPCTAYLTLDSWLDRLGWQDCMGTACRSLELGPVTPYEVIGVCGPVFCPPDFPDELEMAVKKGIVIALHRLSLGIIRNVDSINFVIDPLGAKISVVQADCCDMGLEISESRDWLCRAYPEPCRTDPLEDSAARVQAFHDRGCDRAAGLPSIIWPGVLAAECIVRSLFPSCGNVTITRNCEAEV